MRSHPLIVLNHPTVWPALLCMLFMLFMLFMGQTTTVHAAWDALDRAVVFESFAEIRGFRAAPDGLGGTVVAALDRETFPWRTRISKLSRTGTELWGQDGRAVELDLSSNHQLEPVAVESDGNGGVYVAWVDVRSSSWMLMLSHRNSTGDLDWTEAVDNVLSPASAVGVEIVPLAGLGVTIGYAPGAGPGLMAQRFDASGSRLWVSQVNASYAHDIQLAPSNATTEFDMDDDGSGGVVFSWLRYDAAEYANTGTYSFEIGAQRIDGNGAAWWGGDGVMVWEQSTFPHVNAYHAKIACDGTGGVYVVTSAGSRAYGQYIDGGGTPQWGANGIVLQATDASTFDLDTDPQITATPTGELILVQHRGAIYGQRVNAAGALSWGTAGLTLASGDGPTESFDRPCIDGDGFGGALVGWRGWDSGIESVGGLRVDAFGIVLWSNDALATAVGDLEDVQVVANGTGAAHFLWHESNVGGTTHRVHALGVNGNGGAPLPTVAGIAPDAGDTGDVVDVLIAGDFLDEDYSYQLERLGTRIDFAPVVAFGDRLVGSTIDLAGASRGGYDLVLSRDGTDVARLEDAFGVGPAPGCPADLVVADDVDPIPFGSMRKTSIAPDGSAHFAQIRFSPELSEYVLERTTFTGAGTTTALELDRFGALMPFDLAATVDANGRDVVAYVQRDGDSTLHLRRYDTSGNLLDFMWIDSPSEFAAPTVAVAGNGDLHAVAVAPGYADNVGVDSLAMLRWSPGSSNFYYVGVGSFPREPDMTTTEDGLALVFVRQSFLPGTAELCLMRMEQGAWTTPEVLSIALSITSPSIASDHDGELLIAWVADNSLTQDAPALVTAHVVDGVAKPHRLRATDGPIDRVQVASSGPSTFSMLTQETGQPVQFFLRNGNGDVFFTKRRMNETDDVDWPSLAVGRGNRRAALTWIAYPQGAAPTAVRGWYCAEGTATSAPEVAWGRVRLSAAPNPFNPSTELTFSLTQSQSVRIDVFDVRGRRVRVLLDEVTDAGPHRIRWDGRDDGGSSLASGVYLARMVTGDGGVSAVKLALVE